MTGVSLGTSRSESRQQQSSQWGTGSTVAAGGDVSITATGGGKDSDLTVVGSTIRADGDVTLKADDAVNLLAGQNSSDQRSSQSSSSASLGIGIGLSSGGVGLSGTLGVSAGRGHSDGQDVTHTQTVVAAGKTARVDSGGDTTLHGAEVRGEQIIADIGGDLTIASVQDSSRYQAKEHSVGANISVPIGGGSGFGSSVNVGKTDLKSDYLSVQEQSGLKAGDEGFQVNVKGNTDLTGAVIASTDKAVTDGKNSLTTGTLTTRDLENKAEYSGQSLSLGGGYSSGGDGSGDDKGSSVGKDQQGKATTGADQTPGSGLPSLDVASVSGNDHLGIA